SVQNTTLIITGHSRRNVTRADEARSAWIQCGGALAEVRRVPEALGLQNPPECFALLLVDQAKKLPGLVGRESHLVLRTDQNGRLCDCGPGCIAPQVSRRLQHITAR